MRLPTVTASIQAKIFGVIFALTFAVVGFLTTYFPARQIESVRHGLETRALSYAHLLAKETESAVAFDDRETAREVFAAMGDDGDVRSIALYKSNGQTLHAMGEASPEAPAAGSVGAAPQLAQAKGAIVAIAPVISKEGPRGVLVLEMSTDSIDIESARIRKTAAVVGVVALLLGALGAFGIGRSLANRLGSIARTTQAVAAGNLDQAPIADTSQDEVGQLARSCNRMLENLRGLVAQIRETAEKEQVRLDELVRRRTAELDGRNQDMRLVLDHVSQGLLTVEPDGTIAPEHSRAIEAFCGAPAPGATLWGYVGRTDAIVASWLELGWSGLGEDVLPLEVSVDQLPKTMRAGERALKLEYTPILAGERVAKVLVIVSDVTAENARARGEEEQREILRVFERVTKDRAGFMEFFADAKELLARIVASPSESTSALFRDVHTLKGNCAMYGLTSVAAACHEMESRMAEGGASPSAEERDALARRWTVVSSKIAVFLGGTRTDRLELAEREHVAHLQSILNGTPRRDLALTVAQWKLEATSDRLSRLAMQVEATAERLGKSVVVTTEGNDLRLDAARWAGFWGAFTHMIRNAVDHGVESADERVAATKPPAGAVTLRTVRDGADWLLEIKDDGAGVDWDAVAKKGRALGLATATRADLVEVLFRDGVSTKAAANEISGRGVGLGAVRAECEARGGTVGIDSTRGRGTTFTFRFPASSMGDTIELPRDLRSVSPAA